MIRIAMRICAVATKAGWTSASAKATTLATITFVTLLQVLASKLENRM